MTDEITLTIPRGRDFHGVAHLVLGGIAVRADLTLERLQDLELAVDSILDRIDPRFSEEVTVRMLVADGELETVIGPLSSRVIEELERERDDELDLRRVLDGTVDAVQIDGDSVRLTKRVADGGE